MAPRELPLKYRYAFLDALSREPYSTARIVRYRVPHIGSKPFWPNCPPSHRIGVYCSTIHVDSVIILLQARQDLHPACVLEVMFHDTSSVALEGFLRASGPAMITVTQGTAGRLQALARAGGRYYELLRVPPGALRWTSPEAKPVGRIRDVRALTLVHIDHPSDLLAVSDFQQRVSGRIGLELELMPPLTQVPEARDQYRGDSFYLTNSFMDRWALAGKEPAVIPGWKSIERRYLFVNGPLCDLVDGSGRSIALFLQEYFAGRFENLFEARRRFFTDFHRLGGPEYMLAGGRYLGVL